MKTSKLHLEGIRYKHRERDFVIILLSFIISGLIEYDRAVFMDLSVQEHSFFDIYIWNMGDPINLIFIQSILYILIISRFIIFGKEDVHFIIHKKSKRDIFVVNVTSILFITGACVAGFVFVAFFLSLNMAQMTFQLDFEDWYQNGYWSEKYIPYSIADGDIIAANVSVNLMEFDSDGKRQKFIQLGTVMTRQGYRNQGLIRELMKEIERDYKNKVDGYYLFANDSVLEFYPQFGFRKGMEYQYSKSVPIDKEKTVVNIPMKMKKDWKKLEKAIAEGANNSSFEMKHNPGLVMFYVTKFMQEQVFYVEEQKAYVIAELEEHTLFLHNIFSPESADILKIAEAFGKEVERVVLGFTPLETEGYEKTLVQEADTTLFLKGKAFEQFEKEEKMFETLSHA